MVNDHYPYEKWLFHWEYTLFSDKPIYIYIYVQLGNSSPTSLVQKLSSGSRSCLAFLALESTSQRRDAAGKTR